MDERVKRAANFLREDRSGKSLPLQRRSLLGFQPATELRDRNLQRRV
jgi:hypothetical protein